MRRLFLPLAAVLLLAGCAPTVSLTPAAPEATSVGCAQVVVGIRGVQTIGVAQRRTTDAQGTAAWGTPAAVTMRCGVETPEASGSRCFQAAGIDWLLDDSGEDRVVTTYGRDPGVQIVTTQAVSANDALDALGDAIAAGTRPTGRVCIGVTDSPAPPS